MGVKRGDGRDGAGCLRADAPRGQGIQSRSWGGGGEHRRPPVHTDKCSLLESGSGRSESPCATSAARYCLPGPKCLFSHRRVLGGMEPA